VAGVRVITDSSACLPEPALADPCVRVLPISILLPDGEWPDGPATAPRVYAALASGQPVQSSPPTAVEYLDAIEGGDFEAAVVVTPAVEFTVMYRNATVAGRLSSRPVEVVDCRTAAAAQTLVVLAVLDAVHAGASAGEAAAVARSVAGEADLVAALPTMSAVEHNASLPPSSAGRVDAGMPSLFRFHSGSVTHVGDVRPGADAVDAIRQTWAEHGGRGGRDVGASVGPGGGTSALVFHADEEDLARRLAAELPGHPGVVPFSPAMAIHTGPGWLGLAWLTAPATA
jgi:fatty acid-binding protein DegV